MKKKYAIVGAGVRCTYMFAIPLVEELSDVAQLVGICDVNEGRARLMSERCGGVATYDDFERMLDETKPDRVIVTTIDSLHHDFIIRALRAGCDVITEKPMTIDAVKCQAIMKAEAETGKKVAVTFNMRFMPYVSKVKQLLKQGAIGEVLHMNVEWFLDTRHGADYFRRWHRHMEKSGGLLLHKSTHHFDMINWWLDDHPETVQAFGDLKFYGPNREERGERCHTCAHAQSCSFYYNIAGNERDRTLYLENESYDGYYRDRCVFSEEIDIYDTMAVQVRYERGTTMSYSLSAYNPIEGWRAVLVGTKGRLIAEELYPVNGEQMKPYNDILLYNEHGERTVVQCRMSSGDHGGGDSRLRDMLFRDGVPDPLGQQAGTHAGAMSLLIGAGANVSIAEGRPVSIRELVDTSIYA
ncbi:Gfo/Idh/MocA family oxidoreductase [Paenibacillus sp. J5C_2022]|uniref:Gfo/Idh/MocA family protein n=1 Tax=Paenibacillus sp. J5C2022 TaxID=2977129 RepID=UPI0021CFFDA4|nr:Gfo/Idh/MocA family oxidoreductase [Paenibacillus sp. J5C2022]MCU6707954.1 Gfo/Idh/MocA family oxidoreductase [Paenibacillus sp. J5C2022]